MHWISVRRSVSESSVTMASDGSSLLALTKWSDEGHYLREFVNKYELPQVARIVKGQYLTLGVPSLPNPSLSQTVFLWSTAKRLKVAAQCVKFKEGKKVVSIGPKLAIPENYEGWFEILSEEGRAVRCVECVAELARRFPDSCLVRENIKAYVAKGDDLETITDKVRTISAGETLVLVSEVLGTSASSKVDKNKSPGRFLRCFDARGENVYLSFEQKGKFSIIAKEDNISGVHSIKNLLTKRFPMMVRLVSGKTPVGGKASSNFVPELRLFASFEEECLMAMALQKENTIVAVPVSSPMKLQAAKNVDLLNKTKEFARLEEKCQMLVEDISNKIQVFDIQLSKEVRQEVLLPKVPYFRRAFSDPQGYHHHHHRVPPTTTTTTVVTCDGGGGGDLVSPDKDDSRYDEIDQIYDYVRGFAPPPKVTSDDSDYQENVNPLHSSPSSDEKTTPSPATTTKPEPPPIETIPVRRHPDLVPAVVQCVHQQHPLMIPPASLVKRVAENIYERIPRKTPVYDVLAPAGKKNSARYYVHARSGNKNKIYVKSAVHNRSGQKSRVYRQNKNSCPLLMQVNKEVPRTVRSGKSSTASPIFNIRYKSLTNLALEFDTLDSSNSGGGKTTTSGNTTTTTGSGGGNNSYIYEDNVNNMKKTAATKLPRPKSLSNLVKDNNRQLDYNRANLLNNAMNRLDPRRCSKESSSQSVVSKEESEKSVNVVTDSGAHKTKRIGTFYL